MRTSTICKTAAKAKVQCPDFEFGVHRLLGGSWDLVTTYNWAYSPTYTPLNNLIGITPLISRVITPFMNSY